MVPNCLNHYFYIAKTINFENTVLICDMNFKQCCLTKSEKKTGFQLGANYKQKSGPNLEPISACILEGSPWPNCYFNLGKTNNFESMTRSENKAKSDQHGAHIK